VSTASTAPWWEALYDDLLADVLLERDDAATQATLAFLQEHLRLEAGMRIFDQCCGIGSLSLPLAARGLSVVGVDQAAAYVERGNDAARTQGLDVHLVAADARAWRAPEPCHAAFNWWTSFGYAADDEDNRRMLERAFESLRPGGRFALDTMNLPGVLRGFQPAVVTRRHTPRGEVTLVRETLLDLSEGMMKKTWTYLLPGDRRVEHRSAVRLYLPHTLACMLRDVGFEDIELLGSVRGEPLALESPRCIAVARRPS
jgi:2-polyprenyl-3-methyl-5-hydroxy-6-metoxy-1,4-benzoquinol methylase